MQNYNFAKKNSILYNFFFFNYTIIWNFFFVKSYNCIEFFFAKLYNSMEFLLENYAIVWNFFLQNYTIVWNFFLIAKYNYCNTHIYRNYMKLLQWNPIEITWITPLKSYRNYIKLLLWNPIEIRSLHDRRLSLLFQLHKSNIILYNWLTSHMHVRQCSENCPLAIARETMRRVAKTFGTLNHLCIFIKRI